MNVQLTPALIEGFAAMFLSPRYDKPRPTPAFHRVAWGLYCSDVAKAEVIAPRDHAKSTGLTFVYALAEVMFRAADYVIVVGATEELAQEQLSNISEELHENEDLIREFGPFEFEVDQKTEIICRLPDGHRFRLLAKGAEQRVRGRMWKGKRPNLIICDDMEDDEQVESRDRRRKFRRWFFRALVQSLGKGGKIRVHGTILHEDSLLARLRKNSEWRHLFYKAHESFDDFSNRLWPERWSEQELRAKRQEFMDDHDAPGYAQEFLNDPQDTSEPYLRESDFISMKEDDHEAQKLIAAAWDFAVSKSDSANNSSCTVGGKDIRKLIHVIDQRTRKMDSLELMDEFFIVQKRWLPDVQFVEDGQIWKTLAPMLYKEMTARDVFINIVALPSVKDKATRGRVLQRHHRAGAMRFDKKAPWYPAYEHELLRFREDAEATLDDQFDSSSLLCRGFEQMADVEQEDFETEEEQDFRRQDPRRGGRSQKEPGWQTGYN